MPRRSSLRGIALLESLVALLILAIGILGVLGVQFRLLSDTRAGARRSQAIRLIADLSERIQANPQAGDFPEIYTTAFPASFAVDCTKPCTARELAMHDIAFWHRMVASEFSGGQALVFSSHAEDDSPYPRQIGVLMAWRETPYESAGDRTQSDLNHVLQISINEASPHACPEHFVCHLQYINLPAHDIQEHLS